MKLVLVNVGISGGCRGVIFPDRSFVFVPLNNESWRCRSMPYFEDLLVRDFTHSKYLGRLGKSLADIIPSLSGIQVHNDPDFKDRTYGHAKRGFGYEKLIRSLRNEDILLFYATLDFRMIENEHRDSSINPKWGVYIVGAFDIESIYESDEFEDLSSKQQMRFKNNPHYYCETGAHLWIAGKRRGSGLFQKAIPLSSPRESTTCLPFLRKSFMSAGGKPAGSAGWYRAAFECNRRSEETWAIIKQQSVM